MNKNVFVLLVIFGVLFIDQSLKFWVKLNMEYGDFIPILGQNWAFIHFVENDGMAFGWSLGGDYGKLALSLFRILAVGFLIYIIRRLIREGVPLGVLTSFALIMAGALGNILDSAFYGLIFSASPLHGGLATVFPEGGGYAGFLHGRVVDMLYFPLYEGFLPEWIPFFGGKHFTFFKPVFNIADSAITIGVLNILFFHRKFFDLSPEQKKQESNGTGAEPEADNTKEGENKEAHLSSKKDESNTTPHPTEPNSDSEHGASSAPPVS